jgi:hypothetical protein
MIFNEIFLLGTSKDNFNSLLLAAGTLFTSPLWFNFVVAAGLTATQKGLIA